MLKQQFEVNGHFFKKYDSVIDFCDISSALDVASMLFSQTIPFCAVLLQVQWCWDVCWCQNFWKRCPFHQEVLHAQCWGQWPISYHYPAGDNNLIIRMRNLVNLTGFIGLLVSERWNHSLSTVVKYVSMEDLKVLFSIHVFSCLGSPHDCRRHDPSVHLCSQSDHKGRRGHNWFWLRVQ